jgi:hypothetical protein
MEIPYLRGIFVAICLSRKRVAMSSIHRMSLSILTGEALDDFFTNAGEYSSQEASFG